MVYFQLLREVMLPQARAPTTNTTKCHYYEKPSTVPVASRCLCIEKEKERKRDENREGKRNRERERRTGRRKGFGSQAARSLILIGSVEIAASCFGNPLLPPFSSSPLVPSPPPSPSPPSRSTYPSASFSSASRTLSYRTLPSDRFTRKLRARKPKEQIDSAP